MPIVVHNGESFSCSKAVKGIDYIALYDNDALTVQFSGVVDFSAFTITEGDWSEPAGAEEVRGAASIVDGMLIIDVADETGDGTLIKFCAPCGCDAITAGTKIGDIVYDIVDAAGNIMTGPGGAWVSGAQVALVLSKSTAKAYLQNSATTDSYTRAQSLSDEVRETLRLGDTATPADAFEKLSNPLNTLAIGDVFHSANNIEELTNGAFIKMDGRTIDRKRGYPDLADVWELKYRIANPVTLETTFSAYGGSFSSGCNKSVELDGAYFWVPSYGASTSYQNPLMYRSPAGVVTRLVDQGVAKVVKCNNQIIAATYYKATRGVKVYNSDGTLVRTIQFATGTNSSEVEVLVNGTRCLIAHHYNYASFSAWYSDDNFSTYGTTTFDGEASLGNYGFVKTAGSIFGGLQKGDDGYIYLFIYNSSSTSSKTYRLYRSTNNGASFTLLKSLTNPDSGTRAMHGSMVWFVRGGYLYIVSYYVETISSTNYYRHCLFKLELETMAVVDKTSYFRTASYDYGYGGFIYNEYLYIVREEFGVKFNLDTMEWTYWAPIYIPISSYYKGVSFSGKNLVTSNREYWITILNYDESAHATYKEFEERYGGIIVYHIPSERGVYLDYLTGTSSSDSYAKGNPFEDSDGNVIIPTGDYNDDYDTSYVQLGFLKLSLDNIALPNHDYAYIKAMEVE